MPPEVRMARHLHHFITSKREMDLTEKGLLMPPSVSFDDNIGEENTSEPSDDEAGHHEVIGEGASMRQGWGTSSYTTKHHRYCCILKDRSLEEKERQHTRSIEAFYDVR